MMCMSYNLPSSPKCYCLRGIKTVSALTHMH